MSMPGFDFDVPKDAYLNFDGKSLKDQMRNLLNRGGVFTDQNFEGSNLSHVNDVIGFVFGQLLYYLNRQSNEGMFSEAQLYENMNRITRKLDYKPIGFQTPTLTFNVSVTDLDKGLYSIPRYSYLEVGGIKYSFNEDITFAKTVDQTEEELTDLSSEKLLYQGEFIEHPTFTASGNESEIVYLTVDDSVNLDHFNIHVYVKDTNTGKWTQWDQTTSLFLNRATEAVFEARYNESKRYEIKFGNDINGRKLKLGDEVTVYYLKSDGSGGEVGVGVLADKKIIKYDTLKHREILGDIGSRPNELDDPSSYLSFNNDCVSSTHSTEESVASIRENAPGIFRSQYRVVTHADYETFVKTNFSNLIQDISVMNNSEYLDGYIKYFYELGLDGPHNESRALMNQVRFSDSCNFNNVYVFTVPKTVVGNLTYLNPAQKELVIDTIRQEKVLSSETIVMDPVYLAFDIALGNTGTTEISDRDSTKLVIEKDDNSRRNEDSIKEDVVEVFNTYFQRGNLKLGQVIDINQITSDILSISGVKKFFTSRTDNNSKVEGLRMITWNPAYGNASLTPVVTNIQLEGFQFPYLKSDIDFTSKIIVRNQQSAYEGVEF